MPLSKCQGIRAALFDFDGTLCRVNSYHVFLRWALRQQDVSTLKLLAGLGLRRLRLVRSARLKNISLGRLRGWSRSELDALGRALYTQTLKPNLVSEGLAEIASRKADGYLVMVVSGAFDFMLSPFCQEYKIPHCYSARVAFRGNTCLGRLEGGEMRGEEKVTCLKDYFPDGEIDWASSCAYSDELNDLALLNLVGQPFLVGSPEELADPLPTRLQRVTWK